jgi:hypothetical protein
MRRIAQTSNPIATKKPARHSCNQRRSVFNSPRRARRTRSRKHSSVLSVSSVVNWSGLSCRRGKAYVKKSILKVSSPKKALCAFGYLPSAHRCCGLSACKIIFCRNPVRGAYKRPGDYRMRGGFFVRPLAKPRRVFFVAIGLSVCACPPSVAVMPRCVHGEPLANS